MIGAGNSVLPSLVALVAGLLGMTAVLHLTSRRGYGFLQYFTYAVLSSLGVLVFFSGRSLSSGYELADRNAVNAVTIWTSRLSSAYLVVASLDRILSRAWWRYRSTRPSSLLLLAFSFFWCTTVASPALLAPEGSFTHEDAYPLLIGCALLLLSDRESAGAVAAARNGVMAFLAIGVALIPLRPAMVWDRSYATGLLPGLPRFAGLTTDPVSLGMLAQLSLLCLYAYPLSRPWLNRFCWALGLFTLFLAQSKVSWLSFPVCAACIFWMRDRSAASRRVGLVALLFVTVGLGLTFIFGNFGARLSSFLGSQQGTDLASLTGRDKIWAVALGEWARHPLLGYGSSIFDDAYRTRIGMPYAYNAHNQLIDTLARSGLVGAVGLAFYVVTLFVLSGKAARATRGLSLAIFLALVFRGVSEVPLALFGYGPETLQQFLLLAILAGRSRNGSSSAAAQPASEELFVPGTPRNSRPGLDPPPTGSTLG